MRGVLAPSVIKSLQARSVLCDGVINPIELLHLIDFISGSATALNYGVSDTSLRADCHGFS